MNHDEPNRTTMNHDEPKEPSVCNGCMFEDGSDYWTCRFCCAKCYEEYGKCPNPECDPMDI